MTATECAEVRRSEVGKQNRIKQTRCFLCFRCAAIVRLALWWGDSCSPPPRLLRHTQVASLAPPHSKPAKGLEEDGQRNSFIVKHRPLAGDCGIAVASSTLSKQATFSMAPSIHDLGRDFLWQTDKHGSYCLKENTTGTQVCSVLVNFSRELCHISLLTDRWPLAPYPSAQECTAAWWKLPAVRARMSANFAKMPKVHLQSLMLTALGACLIGRSSKSSSSSQAKSPPRSRCTS